MTDQIHDIAVIGGGINGAAVARDAAGRGHSVYLAERADYAEGTSSRSSKLIHGGIRYLEQYEFRLVRESLHERETLMAIAPHLVYPLRFLVPIKRGQDRPAWMVRLGLFFYDFLSGRKLLARSGRLKAGERAELPRLRAVGLSGVLHYPDCWCDDARLTLETLLDARGRGANIGNRREVEEITPLDNGYELRVRKAGQRQKIKARFVVNAAGPWATDVLSRATAIGSNRKLRLVRGSHIIVRMPAPKDPNAYLLQNEDGRVVFVIPWLDDRYRILGTTDVPHEGDPADPHCSDQERDYILDIYNRYFDDHLTADKVIGSYSGVRPLVDDGADNPSKVSREYELDVHQSGDGAFLTIFGGKLTTHRTLGELVLSRLEELGLSEREPWTKSAPLHGGSISRDGLDELAAQGPGNVPVMVRRRWVYTYGDQAKALFTRVTQEPSLAETVVPGVPLAELLHVRDVEDARTGEDFLYRRTKLFIDLDPSDQDIIRQWFKKNVS